MFGGEAWRLAGCADLRRVKTVRRFEKESSSSRGFGDLKIRPYGKGVKALLKSAKGKLKKRSCGDVHLLF